MLVTLEVGLRFDVENEAVHETSPSPEPLKEVNLCALYGDHEECPYQEVDEDGTVLLCSCNCHFYPGSQPE